MLISFPCPVNLLYIFELASYALHYTFHALLLFMYCHEFSGIEELSGLALAGLCIMCSLVMLPILFRV
jgi:hypothetical protein